MPEQQIPEQDDRSRRIEALRNLAQQDEQGDKLASDALAATTTPAPDTSPAATARRSRKSLLAAFISALVLIAVAGGLIAHAIITPNASSRTPKTPATLIINPGENDFACPRDIAWSPNSKTVALLGYQGNCANAIPSMYAYHPGIVTLYDVTKGKVIDTLQLDPIIATALDLKPPTIATPMTGANPTDSNTSKQAIDYRHLLWSPDGKQLAVTFWVNVTIGQSVHGFNTTRTSGILLISPKGMQTRILSHTLAHNEWYSGLWNLASGTYVSLGTPDIANTGWSSSLALVPPSSAYQWIGAGRLQATTPSTAIGQPDGGDVFSIWQPGVAQVITQIYSDNPQQPPENLKTQVETWSSSFAAWSADGNYFLADSVIQGWRIAFPGKAAPDKASLSSLGLEHAPLLPIRDAAMAAVLQSYHNLSQNPAAADTLVNLAWSPDGKWLAVEAPIPDLSGAKPAQINDYAVHIYDCASGKLLATLVPDLRLNGIQTGAFLRWSPDSSHLLLYDTSLSGAQIWGRPDLPH